MFTQESKWEQEIRWLLVVLVIEVLIFGAVMILLYLR